MPCVFPIDAWRSQKCNESGKRGITFRKSEAFLDMPLQIPCSKCIGCRADRAKIWAIRMYHEATQHEQNSFITLTYKDSNQGALDPEHLRLFIRRLRKLYPVRYFAVGEYGSQTHRPHYHAVIFGQDFMGSSYEITDQLYSNKIIDRLWGHGIVSVASVNMATCAYVAGYVNKKIGDTDTFNRMSRRPGIGHSWLDKYRDDLVRTDRVVIEGKEYPIPKKYIEWYEEDFAELALERQRYFGGLTPDEKLQRRLDCKGKQLNYEGKSKLKSNKI